MSFAKIFSFISAYSLWLYVAGFLAALFCLREIREAKRNKAETIFSLEKELATARENRARTTFTIVLAALVLLTWLKFLILPSQPLPPLHEPTPTQFIIQVPTSVSPTPTPTKLLGPTRLRPTPSPTATPTLAISYFCPQPGIRITSPAMNQIITGQVTIRGTAKIETFQFYKLEYGYGEAPQQWNSIGEIHKMPVVNDVLGVWDTRGFPSGVYKLRLTVVDITGNFPPPCEIRVVIRQ